MRGDGQDVELVINDETLLTRGQRKNKSEAQNHHNEVLVGSGAMSTQQSCGFSSGKPFGPTSLSQNPVEEQHEVTLSLLWKAPEHTLYNKEN